ncbi:uncharacterized protein BX664DRAFT_356272 [Halteromyces radiatus]|uniref:uncharacterized protein n=1 Tax=Halteromyces radiatus TaxID=101107 RepID=UPI0022202F6C|nr:uncharacterized protein BX664DRAFT_356272 [Halteromyces radiatus]KAI8096979.1 hypothetical protein BX664DRAFT_356272 [Halteromyces radiatus]
MTTSQAPASTTTNNNNNTSFFSSFASSFVPSKTATDISKKFNSFTQTLQQRARELPKNISRLPDTLDAEHDNFVRNKKTIDEKEVSTRSELVMPWDGYGIYEQELKRRILEIPEDQRNFIIPPPEDTTFEFDLKAYSQSARAILTQDKALSHMRFLLVPQQVNEVTFWRNYFYRVTTVKKAVLSDTTIQSNSTINNEKAKNDGVLFDFAGGSDDDDEEEGYVDDKAKNIQHDQESKQESNKKPIDDTKTMKTTVDQPSVLEDDEMEEWERELRRAAAEGL